MSMSRLLAMQGGIQDCQFLITPKMITLPKNIKCLALYLQKGRQVIGTFRNKYHIKDTYKFTDTSPALYIGSNSNCRFTWSIYSVDLHTNQQTLLDETSFNIQKMIQLYQIELLEREREIQTQIKHIDINKGMISDLWHQVKLKMKSHISLQKSSFPKTNQQIEFQIEIKNHLDIQRQRGILQEEKSTLRKLKSHQSFSPSEIKSNSNHTNVSLKLIDEEPNFYKSHIQSKLQASTRQTIEGDEQANGQGTRVLIVGPQGQNIESQSQVDQGNHQHNFPRMFGPLKKFSMLSDIMQMSQGSNSHNHPENDSQIQNKNEINDKICDVVIEESEHSSCQLNRFKTLPHQTTHHLEVRNAFRRTLSFSKIQNQIHRSQIQSEQNIFTNQQWNEKGPYLIGLQQLSKKKNLIIVAFLLLVILSVAGMNGLQNKKTEKRKRRV